MYFEHMLTLHTRVSGELAVDDRLILPYELREKSRLRARTEAGQEVALLLQRGSVMRDGDLMSGPEGKIVQIVAAAEPVYQIASSDTHLLLRCAYHLGNRHTQVQLGDGWLRIRQDPVLKDMAEGLGASVSACDAPFEPEAGAYGGGHHHGEHHALAPVPVRQRIHRPSDRTDS